MEPAFGEYAFADVGKAPTGPGIYSWYGALRLSIADFKREIDESGRDVGAGRMRSALARQMARYQIPPIELSSRGSFGARWRGRLHERSHDEVQDALTGDPKAESSYDAQGLGGAMDAIAKEERLRALLARILAEATPRLSAPIYVGVATNLRNRLAQHVVLYRKLQDAIGGDGERLKALRDKVDQEGLEFAHRAVAMDFRPEHLRVCTLDVGSIADEKTTTQQMRETAGVAEWLLNRWHRPLAGRR